MEIENKRVAVITGSTSGIGLGIAHGLAAKGCSIILNGFGDDELIESIKNDFISKYTGQIDYVYADLSKTDEMEDFCMKVHTLYPDGVDIVVNNAGFQHVSPVEDFATEQWDKMLAVMLTAPFQLTKNFLPSMKKKGWGRIINISSVHGIRASRNKAGYVSAKHGLVGLTKVVALEAAGSGVTCNAICPGFVDTPILKGQVETLSQKEGIPYREAKSKFLANFHPTKDSVEIDHLSDMVIFLCSDAASQMTGSQLVIDGGWSSK